ncbi:hypothetical protein GGR50DRAFT_556772 [Xylaria sp. CBS 124048]|nr:hypothetical protein GGR50DRAFT_556772 [Xylaria sp. CBS 124048]
MTSMSSQLKGRPLNSHYWDLVKPGEDWRSEPSAVERRKIQNRLAQRAYRRNMRDRSKEVERLRKEIEQLKGRASRHMAPPEGIMSPSSADGTPIPYQPGPDRIQTVQSWMSSHGPTQLNNYSYENPSAPMLWSSGLSYSSSFPASNEPVSVVPIDPSLSEWTPAVTPHMSLGSSRIHHSSPTSHSIPATFPTDDGNATPLFNTYIADENGASPPSNYLSDMYSDSRSPSAYDFESSLSPKNRLPLYSARPACSESKPKSKSRPPQNKTDTGPRPITTPGTTSTTAITTTITATATTATTTTTPTFDTRDNKIWDLSDENLELLPETTAPALHFAVAGGRPDVLQYMLQQPDINLNGKDRLGYTALQRAAMAGRKDMVALLVEAGAAVEADHGALQQDIGTAWSHAPKFFGTRGQFGTREVN